MFTALSDRRRRRWILGAGGRILGWCRRACAALARYGAWRMPGAAAALAGAGAAVACALMLATSSGVAIAAPAEAEYRLGPGDVIRVQVFQNPDLSVEARVSEAGAIGYPLVGPLQLGGLSLGAAERRVADALRQGRYLKSPQVTIQLLQVRGSQVAVLGQVARPGRFPLETANVRASEMLAAAGGITPLGDELVVISGVREGKPFRRVIDVPALFSGGASDLDPVLAGGDTVFVPRAPMFYIYGQAQRPGSYRVERGMTVMQALAAGGGPTARGSASRLRLHRTGTDGAVVETAPQLTDAVQPNDVIYVRESLF